MRRFDCREHRRGRGRSNKSLSEVIRHDLKTLGLVEEMAKDRRTWKSRIKVPNFR